MTIKKPWQPGFEENSPSELDARITRAVHAEMKAGSPSWLFTPWALLPAGAFAALAIAFLAWPRPQAGHDQLAAARELAEMMKEEQLLRDFEVLRQADMWDRIEREPWPKSKI